jgi:hypothetical protein
VISNELAVKELNRLSTTVGSLAALSLFCKFWSDHGFCTDLAFSAGFRVCK